MITSLVDVDDAKERLASGEQPYAFQLSDCTTMLGPACRYGSDYLRRLRAEGGYAESFDEARLIVDARGASITGIWFIKQ